MGKSGTPLKHRSPETLFQALKALSRWFERQKRVLPWRDSPTLYRVWVSEIMLQQTQVATVVPYFEKFIARFPDVQSLAAAAQEEVLLHWAGLGYYSRARNLHRAAQTLVARGEFPRTREEWIGVPGVGPYTAGAILSIALDAPEAILDGNVERVISRLRRVNRKGGDTAYKRRLWNLSRILVETGHRGGLRPGVLNQALMELGATVCTPRNPRCEAGGGCPLATICRGFSCKDAAAFPPAKARKQWKQVREELHCWVDGRRRVLLRKRAPGSWRAGLWDFLESAPPKKGASLLGEVETKHVVTCHKISRVTKVWRIDAPPTTKLRVAESSPHDSEELRWVRVTAPEVPVGSAFRRTLSAIQARELL